MEAETIDILFLGDIVGKPGRKVVENYLGNIKKKAIAYGNEHSIIKSEKPDFIIANVENTSHGFGLTVKNHNDLAEIGIHAFTSGNHIWDKKEIFTFIDQSDRLIRPLNYPKETQGVGYRIFELENDIKIAVINLIGRTFMAPMDSPFKVLESVIDEIKKVTPIIIIDFHAEATAEKVSMGYFANSLCVSAVIGTHTHIQTADEKILNEHTAYITDAGFCGACKSVIGMDVDISVKRLLTNIPDRFDVAPLDDAELNAVRVIIDKNSGKTQYIERIMYITNLCKES